MKKEGWREMQLLATLSWFASVGFNLGNQSKRSTGQLLAENFSSVLEPLLGELMHQ